MPALHVRCQVGSWHHFASPTVILKTGVVISADISVRSLVSMTKYIYKHPTKDSDPKHHNEDNKGEEKKLTGNSE